MPRRAVSASFVISAVGPRDYPADGLPEIAMVGRSNVGKSMLINALVRTDVARTSATPGKTRLVNVYRVTAANRATFYLVDLPGYGHASGGEPAQEEFAGLTGQYFASRIANPLSATRQRVNGTGGQTATARSAERRDAPLVGAVLAIDARHVGMTSDIEACRWLRSLEIPVVLVATKTDKLSQSERAKLKRTGQEGFGAEPLAVSTVTGVGLDELWKRMLQWIT